MATAVNIGRRHSLEPLIREQLTGGLNYVVAGCMIATCCGYFLLESGSANSFPTYLLAMATIPLMVLQHKVLPLNGYLLVVVALFLVYMAVSVAWSHTTGSVLKHLGFALLVFGFCVSLPLSLHRFAGFLNTLVALVIISAAINAIYSIYLDLALPDYQPLPEARLYALGRLSNPVVGALSYGLVLVLAIHVIMTTRQQPARLAAAALVPLFTYAILLTWSRGTWLALAASLSAGILVQYPGNRQWQALGVLACITLLTTIVLVFLGPELLFQRALSFRPEIWSEFVSRTLAGNAAIGVGMGSDSTFPLPELLIQHPHSLFVATFYYGGLIGLLLYLAILVMSARSLLHQPVSPGRVLGIMLLAYGVTATSLDGNEILTKVNYLWLLIWLPVGMATYDLATKRLVTTK